MTLTIITLISIGILKIDGTTQMDRVTILGLREVQAILGPTPETRPDTVHLVVAIVGGALYAVGQAVWTQEEIDALETKDVRLLGTSDIAVNVRDVVIEVQVA